MPQQTRPPRRTKGQKRPLTAEDLLTLPLVRPGNLSPDGTLYAFTVQRAKKDRKGYHAHIHVLALADDEVRQYTHGERSDGTPVFAPDGSMLAFVAKRGELPGIHLMPVHGGEARTLVEKDGSFGKLSFSPDGKTILTTFVPSDPVDPDRPKDSTASQEKKASPKDSAKEEAEKKEKAPAKEPPVYRHITRLFYRLDGVGFLPREETQVWLFDIETGEGTQLTSGKRAAIEPAFSPDGRRVAFIRNMRPDPDLEQEWTDLFVVSVQGGKPRRIPTPPGLVTSPTFSPDGKQIAYVGHDDLEAPWYANAHIWTVPANGRGTAKCLMRGFDQSAYDSTISDTGAGMADLVPRWSPNGKWIYFLSSYHGSTPAYRVPARGGTIEQVTPDRMHIQSIDLTPDGRTMVTVISKVTLPSEVHTIDIQSGTATRATKLTQDWTRELDVQTPERFSVRSSEGARVEGWILKPPGFRPRRKYPAILEVHGGPMTQYGYTFFHELQHFAAQGYVVCYSNPRGSQGYGRAFAEAIKGDWGNRDFDDVMAVTDYLESQPYVDPKRIGITGGSYGGYMTNWAVGHTRRYRAAVTQRSVVDLAPFFGSSDVGYAFRHTFGAYPWEDLEGYRRQSPLTYAQNIRTPLLIIHSESDLRCNIEQAENLFATLKVLGRRTEFIRFPGEPHGLSRGGRPDRRIVRLAKILDWFERYMK